MESFESADCILVLDLVPKINKETDLIVPDKCIVKIFKYPCQYDKPTNSLVGKTNMFKIAPSNLLIPIFHTSVLSRMFCLLEQKDEAIQKLKEYTNNALVTFSIEDYTNVKNQSKS